MARKRVVPCAETIELLESLLADAQCGALQDIVVVGRYAGGLYADSWEVQGDIGDMAVELRSTVIRLQTQHEQADPLTEH